MKRRLNQLRSRLPAHVADTSPTGTGRNCRARGAESRGGGVRKGQVRGGEATASSSVFSDWR